MKTDNNPPAPGEDLARMFPKGKPGIAKLLDLDVTGVKDGRAVVDFTADERHANPMGTLHGGVLCDLADAAMGIAAFSTLAAGESFTTLELKINFLRPFWSGKLQAIGEVVHRGRTAMLAECNVRDDGGKLIARASSTCMVLTGQQAQGR